MSDDADAAASFMTGSRISFGSYTTINTTHDNSGVKFYAWPGDLGIWGAAIDSLVVNGKNYSYYYDGTHESEIGYYRYDANIGGYLEGWFSIYYKDENNNPHHVTGNFKVKRIA